jgi:hypothetical protein
MVGQLHTGNINFVHLTNLGILIRVVELNPSILEIKEDQQSQQEMNYTTGKNSNL